MRKEPDGGSRVCMTVTDVIEMCVHKQKLGNRFTWQGKYGGNLETSIAFSTVKFVISTQFGR